MQYPTLLVSDTHYTDNPRDEYRWALWQWIRETCVEERVKTLIVLGDLTDSKDNHSAQLTNRLAHEVKQTALVVPEVKIMTGNHDWLLDGQEFFRFLSLIPNVEYINTPREDEDMHGLTVFYLPFTKTPVKDWVGMDLSHYQYIFMHQTIKGAVSSNGQEMEGEDLPDLTNWGKIYSGDIHVPQVIGPVEYVGSPYHVHFGDKFKPRCVLLERTGRPVDLHFETIQRVTLQVSSFDHLRSHAFRRGDQIKLRIELTEAEKHEWSRIRREYTAWLVEREVEVCGVEMVLKKSTLRIINDDRAPRVHTPAEAVVSFVAAEELGGSALDAAFYIMES